jgi:DNA-binding MarR family transcriptional regulator/GNAT superfamily N-acetyltransferase
MTIAIPDAPAGDVGDESVAALRRFNRFYTRLIGLLEEQFNKTRFSLTEGRVLYDLATGGEQPVEVADVRAELGLDAGYLSRILNRFESEGLITRERSRADARRVAVRVTDLGRETFAAMDAQSAGDIRRLLAGLDAAGRRALLDATGTIEGLFGAGDRTVVVRAPRPGEMGWVVERHGALYAAEYGWDRTFEGLCAGIVATHLQEQDRERTAAWIAEVGGRPVGSIACAKDDDATARLRLLLVEPSARGLGVGSRLVDECLAFARGVGYERMVLWTYDVLADARRIYQRAGFELVHEEPERAFGHDLVHQDWARDL